jgi:predicted membrane protein
MKNRTQIIIGAVILVFGLAALLATIFKIDFWALCWGIGLILLGVLILLRPRQITPGSQARFRFIADIKRSGDWQARSEEIWTFVSDGKLDFTSADLPPGETKLRFIAFVSETTLIIPEDVGVSISLNSFYSEMRFLGERDDAVFTPIITSSEGYELAERKILLETFCFVSEVRVKRA